MWCRNLHFTRIRPWAIFYFELGVALHITIRHKEKERLLVVEGLDESEFNITQQTVDEILEIADPNATWVSIGDNEYNDFNVGEQVMITVDGGVNTSFPAQASAKKIELVK